MSTNKRKPLPPPPPRHLDPLERAVDLIEGYLEQASLDESWAWLLTDALKSLREEWVLGGDRYRLHGRPWPGKPGKQPYPDLRPPIPPEG